MQQSVKELSLEIIKNLPDSSTIDDIMETLWVQKKIITGRDQIKTGQGIPHDEAKKRLKKWLK